MSIHWHFHWFSGFFISLSLPSSTMRLFAEPAGPMFLQCFRGSLTIICNYFRWSPTISLAMWCIVQIYSQLFKQKKLFSCQTQESGSLNLQWASAGGKSRKQPKTDSCPFHFLRLWLFCQQYRWQVGPTNICLWEGRRRCAWSWDADLNNLQLWYIYGSLFPGRGKWSKCGIFYFFGALLWPNCLIFSSFLNCSEEIFTGAF